MTTAAYISQYNLTQATAQKRWTRAKAAGLIDRGFSLQQVPTPAEVAAVFEKSAVVRTPEKTADTQTIAQTTPKTKVVRVEKTRTRTQRAVLVGIMSVCAAVSLSNMYAVSVQIKDNVVDAALITALFSGAPFGLLYAGVSGWAGWLVSGISITYEVFCNASGIYRGLAGLGNGAPYEVWQAGGFVDTVSRVTTLEARPCALLISGGMAAIVAAVFITCLIEIKK
jgi:hypothetical protein